MAIALSLLTAAVAKPPFNQLICTFSAVPQLHLVKGSTLVKQVIQTLMQRHTARLHRLPMMWARQLLQQGFLSKAWLPQTLSQSDLYRHT